MSDNISTDINPHCTAISNSSLTLTRFEIDKLKSCSEAYNNS